MDLVKLDLVIGDLYCVEVQVRTPLIQKVRRLNEYLFLAEDKNPA